MTAVASSPARDLAELVGSYWHDALCLYYVARISDNDKLWLENCWTLDAELVARDELEGLQLVERQPETAIA